MNVFVNHDEYRPRAGWRLTIQFILFLLISLLLFVLKDQLISQSMYIIRAFVMTTAALSSVFIAAKFLDRRSVLDYGINIEQEWYRQLFAGLGIGTGAVSLVFLVGWSTGWVTITGYGWEKITPMPYTIWLGSYMAAMILVGFYEELLFRGYQLINLAEGLRVDQRSPQVAVIVAVLVSSVVFGLMHAGNPGASWVSTMNVILAGLVLAVPLILTGRLALSIGLHISWNFVQGGILGFAVSGNKFRGSILQIKQHGPPLYTGGTFGPEAGLMGIGGLAVMLCLTLLFLKMTDSEFSLSRFEKNLYPKIHETPEQGS